MNIDIKKEMVACKLFSEGSKFLEHMLDGKQTITKDVCRSLAQDLVKDGDKRMVEYLTDSFVGSYAC